MKDLTESDEEYLYSISNAIISAVENKKGKDLYQMIDFLGEDLQNFAKEHS